jgi:hypothetical protein
MPQSKQARLNRRRFLQTAGALTAIGPSYARGEHVSIVADPADPIAGQPPVRWALDHLAATLTANSITVRRYERVSDAPSAGPCIVAAGGNPAPPVPDALALVPMKLNGRAVLQASGHDTRGVVYALLELADRVENAPDPQAALAIPRPIIEQPANRVRSIARLFTSDVEDKPWYNDREMWPRYLTMLAAQRFNRFHLALGIGYDFLRQVSDAYFVFSYPFLLAVPGYNVRVPQLPDAERDSNLAMLRYISEQTVARGLEFQLGLWMHGYKWLDSLNPKHTIEGLTPATHGPYCRDAVRALLKACPAISGVTFRVHGESGVEEGSYDFWKAVFEGVATCGRTVRIDMHAKGMDQSMLDVGLASGMPLTVSPKYWAEHLGMPYCQAEIREQERPRPGKQSTGLMKLSAGSRSFLRYGYGDLLREDRRYSVIHRIWPGTQRLLLWGDPMTAAAHSRAFGFCGMDGVDICEPLSFKGRRGSGIAGDRCAYADPSLRTRWDWQKYEYTYRVWGRLVYNPDADPDTWRRYLAKHYGPNARDAEAALANASRILPIVTTAHAPSAANNIYWPEIYTNQSIVDPARGGPYTDTAAPRVFGNASPLDPQLFSKIDEYAGELLRGDSSGKYSPVEVAQWLENYATAAATHLAKIPAGAEPAIRRLSIDVSIQAGLGRFFAAKFRAAVLYRIHDQTQDRTALAEAMNQYRAARSAWAELANRAKGVYLPDITVGEHPQLRGHWLDRLPAIDADIAGMEKNLEQAKPGEPDARVRAAIQAALGHPHRTTPACRHTPPSRFRPGEPLPIEISMEKPPSSVRLFYRHVDQAARFQSLEMKPHDNRCRAEIPADYTNSPYPLEYYFEVRERPSSAVLYPGFAPGLNNQPYFVVRRG